MYPGQMVEDPGDDNVEAIISTRVTEIVELARQIVEEERWEMQSIVFSLFLAGVVSKNKEEKTLALNLMTALERQSYGRNTKTIRRLMRSIYDKQQMISRSGGQILDVDWVEEMRMNGLQLVMFSM